MAKLRKIRSVWQAQPTLEGAGVHLKRVFGYYQAPQLDPFLLLDDFGGDDPEKYIKGFPWHPHRGIETITYVLKGEVEHGDSLGNRGVISAGDVQWMTAGNGIVHQEMPKGDNKNLLRGLQLWANLPAAQKMMAPRYRDIRAAQIPVVQLPGNVSVKVICGRLNNQQGPVQDIVIDPQYLDVTMPANSLFSHPVNQGYTVFAYLMSGLGFFSDTGKQSDQLNESGQLIFFDDGDQLKIRAGENGVRFVLISGKPISEPVAWRGPIVMNTTEELDLAFQEYHKGTFLKHQQPGS